MNTFSKLFGVIFIFTVSVNGSSASLLTNGGFEDGNFSGWMQGGNTSSTGVSKNTAGLTAEEGSYFAYLGPVGSNGTLSQSFSTIVGDTYDFSFYHAYGDNAGPPSNFSALFNGATLLSQTNNLIYPTPWTFYSFDVVATSNTSTIEFVYRNDPSFQGLDNIQVVNLGNELPEPATMLLLVVGLFGFGGLRNRAV